MMLNKIQHTKLGASMNIIIKKRQKINMEIMLTILFMRSQMHINEYIIIKDV